MSTTPLADRLQVKGDRRIALAGATQAIDRAVGLVDRRGGIADAAVVLLAAPDLADCKAELPKLLAAASKTAIIWVAYPKLGSSLASDLSRDLLRALAPDYGLATVAQIAVDDVWSALRMKRV